MIGAITLLQSVFCPNIRFKFSCPIGQGDAMPLSINVGLSRKASKDYQSTGVSINVTAELDQALLAKPDALQKQIGDLYAQAESALTRQSDSMTQPAPHNGHSDRRTDRGNHKPTSRNGDAMTASQRRAILAIADRNHIDLDHECRDIIGAQFDDLSIRQASELIDHLKGQNGRSSRAPARH
jgi:hypothetical protein